MRRFWIALFAVFALPAIAAQHWIGTWATAAQPFMPAAL